MFYTEVCTYFCYYGCDSEEIMALMKGELILNYDLVYDGLIEPMI